MENAERRPVVVVGGGIGGLALALTCHEIGVPVQVLESVDELRPLGVGINVQPNAVRELGCLGLADRLAETGVQTANFTMYSKHGGLIWGEPRGVTAGYNWPQYSVHRGELQMMLYEAVIERLGPNAIRTSCRVESFANTPQGAFVSVEGGDEIEGSVVVGADGIHSVIRAQMYPDEGEPLWSGKVLWRATTRAKPYLDGATMVLSGHDATKFVTYPISPIDPETGEATINWIAQRSFDPDGGFEEADYEREAGLDAFINAFDGWSFGWLEADDDLAALKTLVNGAERIYEYPLVDRDPLPAWTDRRVTLLGDAAHVMYPVGSNGASQAIIDARKLGRAFLDHGVGSEALNAYEAEMRPATERMILTNRTAGPDHIMEIVEQKCGGVFDDIHDVMSHAELEDFSAGYKKTAGFAIAELNASPPIIPDLS